MHGVRRLPVGVVLAHAALALTGYAAWVIYLACGRPPTLGWVAVAWVVIVNGFGDAAVVRRWKKKADGGLGLIGTYMQRIKRPILLTHATVAGLTVLFAVLTVLGY